jgi:predicted dehydrogenase
MAMSTNAPAQLLQAFTKTFSAKSPTIFKSSTKWYSTTTTEIGTRPRVLRLARGVIGSLWRSTRHGIVGNSNFTSTEAVALIGYGYWGKKLYKYLKEHPGFSLASVYFPSLKKHDPSEIRAKWGAEFTSDLERVWQDRSIQTVVIATPIATHYDVVKEALSRGKDVLVEKPLALDSQQASELSELVLEQAGVLETEYTYTYSKALEKAQNLVHEGAIGSLQSISISFQQLGRFLTYDVFLLLGSHALSILDMFVPLDELFFEASPLMSVNNVTTGAIIQFVRKENSRLRGSIDITLHSPDKRKKVTLSGDAGTIIYDPTITESLRMTKFSPRQTKSGRVDIQEEKNFSFDENHNLRLAIDHFHTAITDTHESNINRAVRINQVLDVLRETVPQQ